MDVVVVVVVAVWRSVDVEGTVDETVAAGAAGLLAVVCRKRQSAPLRQPFLDWKNWHSVPL